MEIHHTRAAPRLCLAILCVLAFVSTSRASTRFVDANLTTGANDGTSWANAFRTSDGLRAALAVALPVDVLWVAQGTYLPTTSGVRTIAFELKPGVGVFGGFVGGETSFTQRDPDLYPATLSGDLAGNDGANVFTDNSLHVINGTSLAGMATLDGCVITGGNANGVGVNEARGAGLLLTAGSSLTVRNCSFRGNRCSNIPQGSAVYADASTPYFERVVFEDNVCPGLRLLNAGTVTLQDCVIAGNQSNGVVVGSGSGLDARNSLIAANTLAGVSCSTGSFGAFLYFCTVAHNVSFGLTSTAGIGLAAQNSILYFNNSGGAQTPGGAFLASYACVQGGSPGTGNISTNPGFVDAPSRDYRLAAGSPCIDAGTNSGVSAGLGTTTDLAGNARPVDDPLTPDTGSGTVPLCDMGCFEYAPPAFGPFCFGDGALADHTTPCPCGNNGSAGNGCAHSFAASGANLSATGAALADDVRLRSQLEPVTSFTLFIQHDAADDRVFHDGTLCAAGALVRLRGRAAVGGEAFFPNSLFANDSTLTLSQRGGVVPGQGVRRYYAAWYRNASTTFCPPATANVTNGWLVDW